MTSADRDTTSSPVTDPDELVGKSSAWRRRFLGDIPVGALAGNVPQVPGAGTAKGEKAIAKAMGDVLDRVRRSIRERSSASTSARV
jgi:hypothetical protein